MVAKTKHFVQLWVSPKLKLYEAADCIAKFCHFDPFGFAQGCIQKPVVDKCQDIVDTVEYSAGKKFKTVWIPAFTGMTKQ